MLENCETKDGPVVSVLIPTYNRRRYLPMALSSVVHQDYNNLEIFVIRDGGEDVCDIVNSFNDPRIIFIDRKENRGLPFTLNEALVRAQGKYICYLGDDDRYYPHHVSTLLNVLENRDECQVAYSDLYKVHCKVMPDGSRQVLSKVIKVSRDFDLFFMLYYNHVLHVSLMHRRDLLEKTGLYNEELNILIDWDMTRRLAFFSDFHHVYEITGEFDGSVAGSDRISIRQRKDRSEYVRNVLTIQSTSPPKPWTKIKGMSIIFLADQLNQQAGKTLGLIWRHTFYPYEVYLPLPQANFELNTRMPNIITVPVNPLASETERIDASLARCEGEYVAIVPNGFPVKEFWVENPLHALINPAPVRREFSREGFELQDSTDELWAAVFRKSDLQYARRNFPGLPVRQSLKAAGIVLRQPKFEELPFQFDNLLHQAQLAGENGDWAQAAEMFEYIADHHRNQLSMRTRAAKAFFKAGDHARAAELSCELNKQRPTVDTLLLEAKVKREKNLFESAIESLKEAEHILEGKELLWT